MQTINIMETMEEQKNEQIFRKTFILFLVLLLASCGLFGGALTLFHQSELRNHIAELKKRELSSIQLQQTAVTNEFEAIVSDLLFLSHQ